MTTDQTAMATPIGNAAEQATTGPQQVQRTTLWSRVHTDVSYAGEVMHRLLPLMERIATNGSLDRLFEAALDAEHLGVAAEVFQAAEDSLRAATARKAQEAAAQGVTMTAGTGPNPVITAPVEAGGTVTAPVNVVVPDPATNGTM